MSGDDGGVYYLVKKELRDSGVPLRGGVRKMVM